MSYMDRTKLQKRIKEICREGGDYKPSELREVKPLSESAKRINDAYMRGQKLEELSRRPS